MRRAVWISAALAALACGVPALAQAAGARLDRSFGGKGWVTTALKGSQSLAYAGMVQPNGKIVVAGQANPKSQTGQVLVARYRTDGSLDRGFGRRGVYRSKLPSKRGPYLATSIARDPRTGRLVIAGGYGQGSMLALRLRADGQPDRSFGKGRSGRAVIAAGGIAQSLAIQPDGRILLGGSDANLNGRPMVVARLTAAGKLDPTFATAGIARPLFWDPTLASSAGVFGLTVTATGAIVGAAHIDYIGSDGHGSAGVFALDSSGQPVAGFGSAGHTEIDFPQASGRPAFWFPCALVADAYGGVTITGDGTTMAGVGLLSTRLTAAGEPDPSFGPSGDGRAVTAGPAGDEFTTCGAAPTRGSTTTVGVGSILTQLSSAGTAVPGFAADGRLMIKRPRKVEVNAIARSGAGRVVAAGLAGHDLYVARYRLP